MKKTKPAIFTAVIISLLIFSCEDIFEPNLQKKSITILAPYNNMVTTVATQTFWWEEVKGADNYNLQIVTPNFSSIQQLMLDTTVNNDKFTWTLSPGSYQWQVKACNSSSCTDYVTYNLTIDSTLDLSQQNIVLISPPNNYATNDTSITFKWYELYNADDYRFEITDSSGYLVISPQIVYGDSVTILSLTNDGNYVWAVQAQNIVSSTIFSTRNLTIDRTAPNTPTLINPVNNTVLSDTNITFSWDRGTVTGTTINDSLYIYSDSTMNNIINSVYTLNTTYSDSLGIGIFYWRVISIDAAENKSSYSLLWKFTVQ